MFKAIRNTFLAIMFVIPLAADAATDVGEGHDHRTFHANGKIEYGKIGDSYTSDLVLYLAGNQFMVTEELIRDFQGKHPEVEAVFCETIPPGQIFKGQILKQGEIAGQKIAQNPDIFASVNINHLIEVDDNSSLLGKKESLTQKWKFISVSSHV